MSGLQIPFTGLKKQYHNIREEILAATDEVLRSGQLMNGNHTAEFENWLAKRNGCKYALTCHSGTQALEIIAHFAATEESISESPTALIPAMTFPATANAFIRAGWNVHFIDVDNRGLMDLTKIPGNLDYHAIVLVGLYGASINSLTDLQRWLRLTHNLTPNVFVEDAAQHWLSNDCTRFGLAAAISFDPTKNLPCYGNGGAVVTNNSDLYRYAHDWRDNGKHSDHSTTGTNSRMSELDCALMMVKVRYLAEWQKRRREIATYWVERFKNSHARTLINKDNITEHSFHKFVIEVDARDDVKKKLLKEGIETKVHYVQPLSEISVYRQWIGPDILSVASALSRRVLSLPIYPELTDLQVEYIADQVLDCIS